MFEIGDKVLVLDEKLAMIREILGPEAPPNHHGYVAEIYEDGTVLVEFPIGDDPIEEHSQVAPYHPSMVRHRK